MDLSYQLRRKLPVGRELSVRAIPGPNLSELKTPETHMILASILIRGQERAEVPAGSRSSAETHRPGLC